LGKLLVSGFVLLKSSLGNTIVCPGMLTEKGLLTTVCNFAIFRKKAQL
jgi:hypothetical protein